MQEELLKQLREITEEEKEILAGRREVEKRIYTRQRDFVIGGKQMLEKGKLIDIRTHTRFVHFPRHSHDYIEIIYMCAGETTHIVNNTERVVLRQGDLLFLNQNATHEIYPARECDIAVNFIVLPEFFDNTFEMIPEENVIRDFLVGSLQQNRRGLDYIYFQVSQVLPVQNLVENLIWSFLHKQGNTRNLNQTTMGLLMLHLTNCTDRISGPNPRQYEQSQMFTVLRYIEDHYRSGTLTELAGQMNQSVAGLSRFIKKQTGWNFRQLLQQKRLNQAVFLLTTTNVTIEEILVAVGYDNSSYFHRIFRERYGTTPKKYRVERKK
ncbi:MAG: AraC family transcriptional regulator [Lachnospiraceae bacterium]|nr:AraC family transcriptional regulator [Lachnospiraceae bacterium]MCI9151160.1 AraC family transcriptional regulator [Lachnospiraceae bacterium]